MFPRQYRLCVCAMSSSVRGVLGILRIDTIYVCPVNVYYVTQHFQEYLRTLQRSICNSWNLISFLSSTTPLLLPPVSACTCLPIGARPVARRRKRRSRRRSMGGGWYPDFPDTGLSSPPYRWDEITIHSFSLGNNHLLANQTHSD